MPKKGQINNEKQSNSKVGLGRSKKTDSAATPEAKPSGIEELQQTVGNKAVQRLLAQRDHDGAYTLDEETEERINQSRGAGQPLSETVQKNLGTAMGQDFSEVRAHTSAEADKLNRQLGAQAFTTGKDIFFREGQYQPEETAGQELLAHELTHVVQQSHGVPDSGPGMQVTPPGDAYEQEADQVAKSITELNDEQIQRQELPEEEQEEELMQPQRLQAQDELEEEELLQGQPVEEEEELMQPQRLQAQDELEEEELLQGQPVEEEEELMQPQYLQAQDELEEEELLQGRRLQRQEKKDLAAR